MLSLCTVLLCACNCSPPPVFMCTKQRSLPPPKVTPLCAHAQTSCCFCTEPCPPYGSWKSYCVHETRSSLPEKPYYVHTPVLLYAAWACTACHVYRKRPQTLSHSTPDTQATPPSGAGETSFQRTKPHDPYFFVCFIFFWDRLLFHSPG